jgi:hypothetical protein
MRSLLLARTRSGIILGPTRKPAGPAVLDFSHPLTRGIFDCLIFNEGAGNVRNLVPGAPDATIVGSGTTAGTIASWETTSAGLAGRTYGESAAAASSSFQIPYHGNWVAADFSVRLVFYPITYPASFTTTLVNPANGAVWFCLYISAISSLVNFFEVGGQNVTPIPATVSIPLLTISDLVITRSGSLVTFYVNGVASGTASGSTGTTYSSGSLSLGGGDGAGDLGSNADFISMQTWTRALSATEVLSLYLDPYQFLSVSETWDPLPAPVLGPATKYPASLLMGL